MALELTQDLPTHVFVGLPVVAYVEVGEALLGHALLGAQARLDLGEEGAGRRVFAPIEVGAQELGRLPAPVLTDEGIGEAPDAVGVVGGEAQEIAGRRFRAIPVSRIEEHRQQGAANGSAALEEAGRPAKIARRPPRIAPIPGLGGPGHHHSLEQLARSRLRGVAREQRLCPL